MTCPYVVFSDVDETLISGKSMFDFLEFYLTRKLGEAGATRYRHIAGKLHGMTSGGAPRAEVNRAYYRCYAGDQQSEVREAGRRWFGIRSAGPAFFIASTVEALRAHRSNGASLVLVSGSFDAPLGPIAHAIGADHVVCTRPAIVDGRYTGDIPVPMIGENKLAAIQAMLSSRPEIDPTDCFAYGDHPSDLPMMRSVGHPVAVGSDADVRAYATSRRYPPHLAADETSR